MTLEEKQAIRAGRVRMMPRRGAAPVVEAPTDAGLDARLSAVETALGIAAEAIASSQMRLADLSARFGAIEGAITALAAEAEKRAA